MILSAQTIIARHGTLWSSSDFDPQRVGPASYDLCLGKNYMTPLTHGGVWRGWKQWEMPAEGFYILPQHFLLAEVSECVRLSSRVGAQLAGRSSLGRLGVTVHITAGWIDPGYAGVLTLEVANLGPAPVLLKPGMRVAQLVMHMLDEPTSHPYRGRYQGAKVVEACKDDTLSIGAVEGGHVAY